MNTHLEIITIKIYSQKQYKQLSHINKNYLIIILCLAQAWNLILKSMNNYKTYTSFYKEITMMKVVMMNITDNSYYKQLKTKWVKWKFKMTKLQFLYTRMIQEQNIISYKIMSQELIQLAFYIKIRCHQIYLEEV